MIIRAIFGIWDRIVAPIDTGEWAPARPLLWDFVAIAVLGVGAILLRGIDLAGTPPGLHGDEAAAGLLGRRILDQGWIGVYTILAGGNPTGVFHLTAIALKQIDDPIVAVRSVSAITGTLAVVALYILIRRNLGFTTALIGAALLTVSEWHIQFSRTGFVTGTWVTVVILGMIALLEAIRTRSWYWWAIAGAILAAGVYVYNGHAPFLLLTVPAVILISGQYRNRNGIINLAIFGVVALAILVPIINFARDGQNHYFTRSRRISITRTEEWDAQTGLLDHVRLLLDRYVAFWERLSFKPKQDGVDLSGITAPVPETMFWLCTAGLVIALLRRRSPIVWTATIIVLLGPLTSVFTDNIVRRSLAILPFLMLLAAVGMVEVLRIAFRRSNIQGALVGLVLLGVLGRVGWQNYTDFFDKTVVASKIHWTNGTDLRAASEYMATLPPGVHIYFYSDRWAVRYDVIRYLAPGISAEDRAPRWNKATGFGLTPGADESVFVLLGNYQQQLAELEALYPGGEVVYGDPVPGQVAPSFTAYLPP